MDDGLLVASVLSLEISPTEVLSLTLNTTGEQVLRDVMELCLSNADTRLLLLWGMATQAFQHYSHLEMENPPKKNKGRKVSGLQGPK